MNGDANGLSYSTPYFSESWILKIRKLFFISVKFYKFFLNTQSLKKKSVLKDVLQAQVVSLGHVGRHDIGLRYLRTSCSGAEIIG